MILLFLLVGLDLYGHGHGILMPLFLDVSVALNRGNATLFFPRPGHLATRRRNHFLLAARFADTSPPWRFPAAPSVDS